MGGRKSVVGLSLLCALVFSVVSVANASALGTTAFTCVPVTAGTGEFNDSHCKELGGTKSFKHEEIKPGTATAFKATNNETGTTLNNPKLKGTLAGVAVELEGTGVVSEGTLTNEEVGGVMQNVGKEIKITYTGVKVLKPAGANCKVKEEKVLVPNAKSSTIEGEGALGTGVKFEPTTGTTFAEVTFEKCTNEGLNKTFPITGSAVGAAEGATLNFTEASTANLKLGGNKASLISKVTVRMAPEGNPISLTTK